MRVNLNGVPQFNLSGALKSEETETLVQTQTPVNSCKGQSITDALELSDKAKLQSYIDAHRKVLTDEEREELARKSAQEMEQIRTDLSNAKGIFSVNFLDDKWASKVETDSRGYFTAGRTTSNDRFADREVISLQDAPVATSLEEAKAQIEAGAKAVRIENDELNNSLRENLKQSVAEQELFTTQMYNPKEVFGSDIFGNGKDPLTDFVKDIPKENFVQEGLDRYKNLYDTVISRKLSQEYIGADKALLAINDIDRAFENYMFEGFKQSGMSETEAKEASIQFGLDFRTARNGGASLDESFAKALEKLQEIG